MLIYKLFLKNKNIFFLFQGSAREGKTNDTEPRVGLQIKEYVCLMYMYLMFFLLHFTCTF